MQGLVIPLVAAWERQILASKNKQSEISTHFIFADEGEGGGGFTEET